MNLASALFKRILEEEDFDTWSNLKKHYLPDEYHIIHDIVDKHVTLYQELPTLEQLQLSVRDTNTLDKIHAIQLVEADTEPFLLLDYLKNEFTQKETLFELQRFVESSIAFETAEETVQSLYSIVARIEDRVDLENAEDSMQKINLFESDEEIESYIKLGLNEEFDADVRFRDIDYILLGGKRGAGKSIVCANLANNAFNQGKSVLYFTIEMDGQETLQRLCSIATQIPHSKIKYKNLDNIEWLKVVEWFASRFENSEQHVQDYKEHRSWEKFHKALVKEKLNDHQIDIVYEANLTLTKIRAEALKKAKKLKNLGLIIVDYINQAKVNANSSDVYDWKEQIAVSKGIKALAQELKVPAISPYQIDALGEARFAKGILDSADAAYVLSAGENSIAFNCTKMRSGAMRSFISKVKWDTLTIGPENGEEEDVKVEEESPKKRKKKSKEDDTPPWNPDGIYDSP